MQDTKRALMNISTWKRLAYTLFFGFAYSIAEVVFTGLVVAQILFKLFTGDINEQVLQFSKIVTDYISEILLFMTFQSDEMPFPFTAMSNQNHS